MSWRRRRRRRAIRDLDGDSSGAFQLLSSLCRPPLVEFLVLLRSRPVATAVVIECCWPSHLRRRWLGCRGNDQLINRSLTQYFDWPAMQIVNKPLLARRGDRRIAARRDDCMIVLHQCSISCCCRRGNGVGLLNCRVRAREDHPLLFFLR